MLSLFFFFNDTATTEIYTLSLHDALPICGKAPPDPDVFWLDPSTVPTLGSYFRAAGYRTFWKGKWHASDADLLVPGTHAADRKSTRLNSSHANISYAVFCLKKNKKQ